MTAIRCSMVQEGWTVHIGPHDIWRHTPNPRHYDTHHDDVQVKGVVYAGTIVVFYWGDIHHACGAVSYDRDDTVERVA